MSESRSELRSDTDAAAVLANGASNRGLKVVVILLGALIIVAFVLLVVGLVTRFSAKGSTAAQTGNVTVLPPGSEVVASEVAGNRLVLTVKIAGEEQIYILDTESGRLVAQIKAAPPPLK